MGFIFLLVHTSNLVQYCCNLASFNVLSGTSAHVLDLVHQCLEAEGLLHCQIAEHLSINLDVLLLKTIYQPRVAHLQR